MNFKLKILLFNTYCENIKWGVFFVSNHDSPFEQGFFFWFAMLLKWQSSIKIFSHNWLHSRNGSPKKPKSFYIFHYLLKIIIKLKHTFEFRSSFLWKKIYLWILTTCNEAQSYILYIKATVSVCLCGQCLEDSFSHCPFPRNNSFEHTEQGVLNCLSFWPPGVCLH